jgi:hypothetical protein
VIARWTDVHVGGFGIPAVGVRVRMREGPTSSQVARVEWLRWVASPGRGVGERRGAVRSTSAPDHVRDAGSPLRRRRRQGGRATTLGI